jgi:hypothetical protein
MRTFLTVATLVLVSTFSAHAVLAASFGTPGSPYPYNGSIRQDATTTLSWYVTGASVSSLTYDLYWGTDTTPPLLASDVPYGNSNFASYPLGFTSYSTKYYWRVLVRDSQGAYASGPTWSYTTKAQNEPPEIPTLQAPADGATMLPVNVTLDYYSSDFEDWSLVNFDVYLGTDPNPPLIADHVSDDKYNPAPLAPSTLYYWRLVVRDTGGAETSGPTWTFTTANTSNQIPDTPSNPRPMYENLDGPTPNLQWDSTDPDGEMLNFDVYFAGGTDANHPLQLIGTTMAHSFPVGPLTEHTRYFWRVVARDSYWEVKGLEWYFDYGTVPVLFSRFDARQAGDHVEVSWLLHSDEAMDSYTLFRREAASQPLIAIANAPVTGAEGSYVDKSVEAGKTYHYELLVRTTDGDDFRSPVATVSTAAIGLVLHQNVPNPFNPQTAIRYDLPSAARVRLSIVDVSGRRIRTLVDEPQAAGTREALWNGRDDAGNAVSSGVYFYVLDVGKQCLTRKLVLLK